MEFVKILKQLLPKQFKSVIRNILRFVIKVFHMVIIRPIIGNRELVNSKVRQSFRAIYGQNFNASIDNRDEMYRFFINTGGGRSRAKNQERYFKSGETAFITLLSILADHGLNLNKIKSLLEFASGYGRNTRFLVTEINPIKITVSDIDSSAVEVNSRTFGTQPLVSTAHPSDFYCNGKFEVIFVGSLFSHLNIGLWSLWLEQLYKLLEPGGLLIFSTHGIEHNLPENSNDYLLEDGFWFKPSNETAGRLDVSVYGAAWVTETWVQKIIQDHGLGELCDYYPKKLWQQDVYVIKQRTA